jgi:integrase
VLVNDIVNNTPLSYSSVKKIKEGFSGCDKYALTCGLSDKSIMYGVELRKRAPTPKVEIYDSKEVREIVSAAENDKYGVVFLFLLYTGLRAGEMCALTWADINKWSVWVDKTAVTRNGNTIIQPSPKSTASIRSIPLSSKCLSLLPRIQEFWGGGPTVISKKNGEPLNPAALSHAFRRFCAKNGISKKKNSLHSLRDTFASTLINAGADLITVSKLLGHADSRVTEHHYICVADGKKREAVALLSY